VDATNPNPEPSEPSWVEVLRSGADALERAGAMVSRWLHDHREGLGQLASGLLLITLLQPRLSELRAQFQKSEWAYVIERLGFLDGLALMMLLDEAIDDESEAPVLDFIEAALREPGFLGECRARLAAAPLTEPQQCQLAAGLTHFERTEFEAAVPLLIVALEGAFTGEAERRELVRRVKTKIAYTTPAGKRRNLGSAEEVFGLLGLEDDLLLFLRRGVYGDRGNAFRHGVALEGFRKKALALLVALIAYLDLVSEEEGMLVLLVEGFQRQDESQAVVAGALGLQLPAPAGAGA
jgi:hypothetical protein